MLRMVLRRATDLSVPEVTNLVSLHSDDAARLLALYSRGGDFAPDAFDAAQIANGVFYGVEDANGDLIAAGGTHIVDWDAGIGAIGNFYTRPDHRRKGLAGVLLHANVRDLRAGNVDTIVLNVDERNTNAAALYERHGFAVHCPFVEGVGRLLVQRST
jgi:ribosomal protein S18 acetylase RimI-like enzyme